MLRWGQQCRVTSRPTPAAAPLASGLELLHERRVELDVDLGPARPGIIEAELPGETLRIVGRSLERCRWLRARMLDLLVVQRHPVVEARASVDVDDQSLRHLAV